MPSQPILASLRGAISVSLALAMTVTTGSVTKRVSVGSGGAQANNGSNRPSISADGSYVAFYSSASNLVSGDTNGQIDVFVRWSGFTERVSVDSLGGEGDRGSGLPSISGDGRYVAFMSLATNLVSGDTNGALDVFVRDRWNGTTERVSVGSFGAQGNDASSEPWISADGSYVAFYSWASNLVSGDTNGLEDVFVHDRQSGTTERVSIDSFGAEGNSGSLWPSISADGRYVAFTSDASNLVSGDINGTWDVFVRDRQSGTTERLCSSGVQAGLAPSISDDGRYVAFSSGAFDLVVGDWNNSVDVFVHDRQSGMTERVSVDSGGGEGNQDSSAPSISADGRYVAFTSYATNLVGGDNNGFLDVFVHDRWNGTTKLVSVDSAGVAGNEDSDFPSISDDGRCVAFMSFATNLVGGDTNGAWDVFVRAPRHVRLR